MTDSRKTTIWLLALPLLGWLLLFVVAPTALLIVISFCERDFIGRVVYHFTWKNYQHALEPVYLDIFLRSLGYAATATAACLILGYPLAYGIAREPVKERAFTC